MEALSSFTSAASKYVLAPIGTAIHFVALRQPQRRLACYSANGARLLYLANVIIGLVSTAVIVNDKRRENADPLRRGEPESLYDYAVAGLKWSLVPGGGLLVANIAFELNIPGLPEE